MGYWESIGKLCTFVIPSVYCTFYNANLFLRILAKIINPRNCFKSKIIAKYQRWDSRAEYTPLEIADREGYVEVKNLILKHMKENENCKDCKRCKKLIEEEEERRREEEEDHAGNKT